MSSSASFSYAMYATVKCVSFLETLATLWYALKHLPAYHNREVAKMCAGIKPMGGRGEEYLPPATILSVFSFQKHHFIKIKPFGRISHSTF